MIILEQHTAYSQPWLCAIRCGGEDTRVPEGRGCKSLLLLQSDDLIGYSCKLGYGIIMPALFFQCPICCTLNQFTGKAPEGIALEASFEAFLAARNSGKFNGRGHVGYNLSVVLQKMRN